MDVSVIVPVLDEERALAGAVAAARRAGVREIIVVDGGSRDRTLEVARGCADRVIAGERGRALQMNGGAAIARGDVLLFLHADTVLPPDGHAAITRALADVRVVGGRFDVQLDGTGIPYRIIERMISLRSRLTRVGTGDQAIFVRREVFVRLGGFPALPLMEDIAFCRALKRVGRVACLRERVVTSARRWQRRGVVRTVLLMWMLRAAYYAGVSPARLARVYADAR